jgi:ferredoxin
MPGRNRMGPRGQGPMTGRGRGRCAGSRVPLEEIFVRRGGGLGLCRGNVQGGSDCRGVGRATDRGVTAVVSADKCLSCGICVDFCPEQALAMAETVVVDPNRCTGCGSCIAVCANRALSLQGATPLPAPGLAR